jgi:hypothetical protein
MKVYRNFFYSGEGSKIATLDLIDWKAIKRMYEKQITNELSKSTERSKIIC